MTTLVSPTPDDMRTSRAFEALMWAAARPGARQALAEPGLRPLAECLLDRETTFHADDAALGEILARTGARPVCLREAEYVFVSLAGAADVARAAFANVGSALYPDTAATILAEASFGAGTTIELSGPGIAGTAQLAVGGVDPCFWDARSRAVRYPLGFDVFLVAPGELVGLPRSTAIRVI